MLVETCEFLSTLSLTKRAKLKVEYLLARLDKIDYEILVYKYSGSKLFILEWITGW